MSGVASGASRSPLGRMTAAGALVGRRAEQDALIERLGHEGARLVTLTGPVGVGKSRLARAVAGELGASGAFARVVLCDVSHATSREHL